MKLWHMIIICLLFLTLVASVKSKKHKRNETQKVTKPVNYYITNWDPYDLPTPIPGEILKNIMEKIAKYAHGMHCPRGSDCDQSVSKNIVKKIIQDVYAKVKDNPTVKTPNKSAKNTTATDKDTDSQYSTTSNPIGTVRESEKRKKEKTYKGKTKTMNYYHKDDAVVLTIFKPLRPKKLCINF